MAAVQLTPSSQGSTDLLIRSMPPSTEMQFKKVSFHNDVSVRLTPGLDSFAEDEIAAAWYSRAELQDIRSGVRNEVKMLTSEVGATASEIEPRGLESFLPEGLARKQLRREVARDAVLDEQEYQWRRASDDPELLADIYFERTRDSATAARWQGLVDQESVHQDTNAMSSAKTPDQHCFRSGNIGFLHRRRPHGTSSRAA